MGSKSEQDQSQNHIERTRKLCPKIFLVSGSWNLGIYYNDIFTKGNYLEEQINYVKFDIDNTIFIYILLLGCIMKNHHEQNSNYFQRV